MIRLLTAVFLFASVDVVAQTQVPNVFEDGTPASAAEVNANFDALETAIDAIPEGPAGPQGEKGDKGDTGATGANGSDGFSTYQTVEGLGPGLSCGEGGSLFRSWLDVNSNGVFDFGTDSNYIESTVCNGVSGTNGTNGADGADGVAAGLNCTTDQIIKWNGSAWVCSSLQIMQEYYSTPVGFAPLACPSGKQATGGGCHIEGGDCNSIIDKPRYDLSGWECQAYGGTDCSGVRTVYAICQ